MALFMDLVALSNGLHGSVQMDSVALFSWIGWLRHHGIFMIFCFMDKLYHSFEKVDRIKDNSNERTDIDMRAKIELIRVDNRLVHGQVGVTWVNALNIDTIVVVDDETAINVFSQKMMKTIAKASNVDIRFYSIADFMQVLRHNESNQRLFVVVRDVQTVYEMFKNGLTPQTVNIGNIHYGRGRVPFNKKMYVSEVDVDEINELIDKGFNLYYQDVPGTLDEVIDKIDFERLKKVRK